jgi:outer membrane lipoprotein
MDKSGDAIGNTGRSLTFSHSERDNINMKRIFLISAVLLVLAACSPVLTREVMKQGMRDVPFNQLRQDPDVYKGKLFILGGVIAETRFSEKGSQIEALSVPVDSLGYLRGSDQTQGRFLAVYPKSKGLLDPMVFKSGREITLAGEFVEARKGKIDEMEYVYPVFEIREIYLWDEHRDYYYSNYYYPYYGSWGPYGGYGYPYGYSYPYYGYPYGYPYRYPYYRGW